jgi:hypothetical protein
MMTAMIATKTANPMMYVHTVVSHHRGHPAGPVRTACPASTQPATPQTIGQGAWALPLRTGREDSRLTLRHAHTPGAPPCAVRQISEMNTSTGLDATASGHRDERMDHRHRQNRGGDNQKQPRPRPTRQHNRGDRDRARLNHQVHHGSRDGGPALLHRHTTVRACPSPRCPATLHGR